MWARWQKRWQRLQRATQRAKPWVILLIRLLDGQTVKHTMTTDDDPSVFAGVAHMIESLGVKIDMILTPSIKKPGRHYIAISIAL